MALLAQGRAPGGEQAVVDRSVGAMAQGAVFGDWLVFLAMAAALAAVVVSRTEERDKTAKAGRTSSGSSSQP